MSLKILKNEKDDSFAKFSEVTMKSKIMLAIGSVLTTFGGVGIAFTMIFKLTFVNALITVVFAFVFGIASGMGVVLCLFHMKNSPKQ